MARIAAPRSALHIHLTSDWHNLPAGTEVLLGSRLRLRRPVPRGLPQREAATAGGARGRPRRVPGRPGDHRQDAVLCTGRALAGERRNADRQPGDGITPTGIEAPPPGGSTLTPAIDEARYKAADGPRATSSGRRRRALRSRLRQLPRGHGLPRGQRPVRPRRDAGRRRPVGCAPQRRLESPRRLAVVGRGHRRQLVLLRAPVGVLADRDRRRARQRRRRRGLRRQYGRCRRRTGARALRDPSGGQVGRSAL